jgi:spermidine synthase
MGQIIELFDDYEMSFDSSDDSSPFVHEYHGAVSLHFNKVEVQSAMYKHAPDELVLSYTRTMMGFLVFNKQPRHVGMIGLGGGSMPKYCYRHLPDTTLSIAEINPEVIALRDRFLVPKDDHRFKIHCEDGADFVRRQPGRFDVLLVDGFDDKGQPPQLCSRQFYTHCYRSLTSPGLLVVNVSDGHHLISRIRRSFRNQVIVADGGDSISNIIVFAGKGNIHAVARSSPRTEKLAQGLRIKRSAMIA